MYVEFLNYVIHFRARQSIYVLKDAKIPWAIHGRGAQLWWSPAHDIIYSLYPNNRLVINFYLSLYLSVCLSLSLRAQVWSFRCRDRGLTMSSDRKLNLTSSDGETFEVDEAVALQSQTIKNMIEDDCAHGGIPLPNVTGKILAKVVEYCKKHVEAAADSKSEDRPSPAGAAEEDLKAWDADFVKVDQATLFDLILVSQRSHLFLKFQLHVSAAIFFHGSVALIHVTQLINKLQ